MSCGSSGWSQNVRSTSGTTGAFLTSLRCRLSSLLQRSTEAEPEGVETRQKRRGGMECPGCARRGVELSNDGRPGLMVSPPDGSEAQNFSLTDPRALAPLSPYGLWWFAISRRRCSAVDRGGPMRKWSTVINVVFLVGKVKSADP